MKKIAIILGTRPEAIKLAPVIKTLQANKHLSPLVVSTGQHHEMLKQVFNWFDIIPDIDLALMEPNQTLNGILGKVISALDSVLVNEAPSAVLVQGDTTTAFAGAIAAFNREIPVGHVEAGLRTHDIRSPFPEEANRSLIARVANWHFAPTARGQAVLEAEKVPGEIFITGNTVVDALLATAERSNDLPIELKRERMVLITGHRRENQGKRFFDAFSAIAELSRRYPDVDFVYPLHLNPKVQETANKILSGIDNVSLIKPVSYPEMIALMKHAYLLLTDSGGIQEEAPSLGVPVLIMREFTERQEAIEAGVASLIGTDADRIIEAAAELLDDKAKRDMIGAIQNPFGDGTSSQQIVDILQCELLGA